MIQVGIAKLKDQLSAYLRRVEAGEEVEVLDRKRPIARILPAEESLVISPAAKPFSDIRGRRYPAAGWGVGSLELLLDERGDR